MSKETFLKDIGLLLVWVAFFTAHLIFNIPKIPALIKEYIPLKK